MGWEDHAHTSKYGILLRTKERMSNADHETYLIYDMQKRQRKLYPEDAEALYSGEYIIIDK